MASAPKQAFTLSELAHRTGTSVASCHAILSALVRHGHLIRHPMHKTYRLAPALFAIGQTVREHDPLLAGACIAVEALAQRTGHEALLTARAGEDIIALTRVEHGPFPKISMRVAERAPLRPPLGGTFVAWSSEEEIQAWIESSDDGEDHAEADRARLALLRERGFLVVLRSPPQDRLRHELSEAGTPSAIGRGRLNALMEALYGGIYEPAHIEAEADYPVSIISAPLFDAYGQVAYSMTLGGFEQPIKGAEIEKLAQELLTVCDDVMRENGSRRE